MTTTTKDKILQKIAEIPIQQIEIGKIHSDGKNPNKMRDEQFRGLIQHIKDNGIINPLIITESGLLADGEHRLAAAKEIGLATVPARIIPDDDKLRRILRQTMNKIRGTHDAELDAAEYKALIDDDGIVDLAAYLGEDVGDMLRVLDKASKPPQTEDPDEFDIDAAVEEIEEPQSKPGDMFQLGDHILLCGDATKPEDWARLFPAGETAEMMVTDPPYNVDYTGKTKDALKIQNDKMQEEQFKHFLTDFFKNAMQYVRGAQYSFMSASEWATLHAAFTAAGGYWSSTIIWAKTIFCLSRKDYHPQHEPIFVGTGCDVQKIRGKKSAGTPILYGWKKGGSRVHYDVRTESDIWITDKPLRNELHPTMKPVSLYRKALLNSSHPLDIVVDAFGGSGTMIIAAEQTHRKARVIEYDPKYCDVIIRRWEEFTGKKAEIIDA